jgi:hypothetical protein
VGGQFLKLYICIFKKPQEENNNPLPFLGHDHHGLGPLPPCDVVCDDPNFGPFLHRDDVHDRHMFRSSWL